ncbi:hypothetical protein ABZ897_49550 [Nonomuraea sp. NPDC046802]|uniref:hypothetical protein n=1 Tax=Nonomuraea sp. NPDC046802 TaxID=3154919 RepID=UPI0033D44BA4
MAKRSYTAGFIVTTVLAGGLLASPPASAQQTRPVQELSPGQFAASQEAAAYAKPNCKHRAASHGVRSYWRERPDHGSSLQAVLRCGTKRWGYRHFNQRWSKNFERKIGATLAKPTVIIQEGNTLIYCRKYKISKKKYFFKVVYSVKDVPGSYTGDTGIITSTWDRKGARCHRAS